MSASSATKGEPTTDRELCWIIFNETMHSILHDLLIHRHREHKMMLASLDPTTKLPHCERCNLPRLLDPPLSAAVRGTSSDPPDNTTYCEKRPWCRKPGHDIYGNPFPKADLTGRPPTKKERAEAAKNSKGGDDTPASNEGGTAPPSPTPQDEERDRSGKLEKGEKKASKIDEKLKKGEYVPWQTCPNCKRSLLITRFAKHLEQCMGLSGRQTSRNALAKMNGNGSTPSGSRGGTPAPDVNSKDDADGDDEEDKVKAGGGNNVRKKLLKKGLNKFKTTATNSKLSKDSSTTPAGAEAAPKRSFTSTLSSADLEASDGADSDSNVHVKKRQKLKRVESTASFASQSTADPPQASGLNVNEDDDEGLVEEGMDAFINDASSLVGDDSYEDGED